MVERKKIVSVWISVRTVHRHFQEYAKTFPMDRKAFLFVFVQFKILSHLSPSYFRLSHQIRLPTVYEFIIVIVDRDTCRQYCISLIWLREKKICKFFREDKISCVTLSESCKLEKPMLDRLKSGKMYLQI